MLMIKNNQSGMMALLTIIIVSASVLIMALAALLLGLGELDMGYISQKGSETLSIADSCIEEALGRSRLNSSYSGGTLNVGQGSCIIGVTTDGDQRTITVTANIDDTYYKKIEATAILAGSSVVITFWEEKDD